MRDQSKYDGFIISYTDNRETNPFDMLGVMIGYIREENLNRPETALCIQDEEAMTGYRYYILYGDWRNEYNALAHKGIDAYIEFFNRHLEHITDTSDSPKRTTAIN